MPMNDPSTSLPPIVEAVEVSKSFSTATGLSARVGGRKFVQAVDRCSLRVFPGQSVGLIGESGCGKSTLGRLLIRLETPTAGDILFDGRNITRWRGTRLRRFRRHMQMIFQDAASSLNPRNTVESAIAEAVCAHRPELERPRVLGHITALLDMVGLPLATLDRLPGELSAGEKQRVSIARALAVEPRFIVADEPVSSLDRSSEEQILSLLATVQRELNVAFLFIAHDVETVRRMCSLVAVMYLGRIVEWADTQQLIATPAHPYSRALMMSRLSTRPSQKTRPFLLQGDPPSPLEPPSGCHFHPRCPHADIQCRKIVPLPRTTADGRIIRCHFDFVDGQRMAPVEVSDILELDS